MPDPLSALSLASSIAQLVEFVKDIVSDARQIVRQGVTSENEHIHTVVKDVGALSASVTETYRLASVTPEYLKKTRISNAEAIREKARKEEIEALHDLGEASCEISGELAQLLEGLQIQDSGNKLKRKRDALSMSFKTMLRRDDIQKLQMRLENLQRQLHMRLTYMMARSLHHNTLQRIILRSLMFPEINERHDAIPEAYTKTFEWILSDETFGFMSWAQIESGLYWITGKPGSGKSTLMKYLSNHHTTRNLLQSWAKDDKLVIAKHYFWIAGTAIQKSQAGLLRSLLFQILFQCPEIAPMVAPQRFLENDDVQHAWTMSELMESMRKIADLQCLPIRYCIFVDGLDEYEGEHSEIVQLLAELSKSPRLKLAVSSRPWNVFIKAYGPLSPENKIIMQDLTRNDILTYVQGTLKADKEFRDLAIETEGAADLIHDITSRSNGVFLWVFLIVRSLLRGLTNGDDIETLRQRVAEYPESLDGYFDRMFNSTERVYRQQMGRILLTAVHSNGSLPIRLLDDLQTELKHADYDLWLPVRATKLTTQQQECEIARAKQRLDARCRDLLEIVGGRIDFLHRTVRDFLATRDLHSQLHDRAGSDFDPVISLSKVTLAAVKTKYIAGKDDIFTLLNYERRTATKVWPSHRRFMEHLAAIAEVRLRYIDPQYAGSNGARGLSRPSKNAKILIYSEENSTPDVERFLDVNNSEDWLVSVSQDHTTVIGDQGSSYIDPNFRVERHSWFGLYSPDPNHRMLLLRGYDTEASTSTAATNESHMLVARFCNEDKLGLDERQSAFIRIAQTFFVEPGVSTALDAIFPPLRDRFFEIHAFGVSDAIPGVEDGLSIYSHQSPAWAGLYTYHWNAGVDGNAEATGSVRVVPSLVH